MIELNWYLFNKHSGKLAYHGTVKISGDFKLWHADELLAEIDDQQIEVVSGVIKDRRYDLVITETESQNEDCDYSGFYTHLFHARK